jgi:hypothetical protein
MMVRVFLVISLAAFTIACGRNNVAPTNNLLTPVAPSAAITTTNALGTPGREDVVVNMQDACDPDTFNEALQNPKACVRAGGVKFDQFIAELTRLGFIGPWRNAPSTANVRVGRTFVAINRGGEAHTFTQVADFGGGIVPLLNEVAHVPNVAPFSAPIRSIPPEER